MKTPTFGDQFLLYDGPPSAENPPITITHAAHNGSFRFRRETAEGQTQEESGSDWRYLYSLPGADNS